MQSTLAAPCSVSGRGYWSGKKNTLTFVPARGGTGIQFVRTDLAGNPRVPALADHRVSMPLRTRISLGSAEFDMIEHVMSALYGLQVDNVEIHCTSCEMPGMDGSSYAFALALNSVGKKRLPEMKPRLVVRHPIQLGDDQQFIRVEPLAPGDAETLHLEYQLDYGPHSPIGSAIYRCSLDPQRFAADIAPARTFISAGDAQELQARGIAVHVTDRDLLVFDEKGPVNNQLRFPDECARHKALDLIGDLALTGVDLVGRVTARRSGHQMNGDMAARLRDLLENDSATEHNEYSAA